MMQHDHRLAELEVIEWYAGKAYDVSRHFIRKTDNSEEYARTSENQIGLDAHACWMIVSWLHRN